MSETIAQQLAGHVSRMYRVALRIVGGTDAAQDVAQEACVKALRGANGFDGRAALATWLHRITVNCAHDHLRKNRQMDCGRVDWNQDTVGMLATLDAGPAKRAEQNDTYRLAMQLVAQLPTDCRSAFMLTQLDGYTYDEAAAIENLPRGTIASQVHRARQILMEQMNHHCAGETP
jgi:RNA polymerase sigma-70 factor, ECF subfamily